MPFSYYSRLTSAQKRIYDESDRIGALELYRPHLHRERVAGLATALESGDRAATQRSAQALMDGLTEAFGVPALRVRVQERRPSWQTGELHGLYEADENGRYRVSLWMRTARRVQVVKFKTFLRTLLHELCHHLDYHKLRLRDSFHTQGFYRRESSLVRQLAPEATESGPRRVRLTTNSSSAGASGPPSHEATAGPPKRFAEAEASPGRMRRRDARSLERGRERGEEPREH